MTCTKAGICKLQEYAYEYELKGTSFVKKKMGYPIDQINPFIRRDPEYCILCGRCVRVCKEQGRNVLDFIGRGINAEIGTAYNKSLRESGCTFCGSCIDACPVNALPEADRWRKGREWEYKKIQSVCLLCGCGCEILVSVKDGSIQKINTGEKAGPAKKYICAYGRFGYDYRPRRPFWLRGMEEHEFREMMESGLSTGSFWPCQRNRCRQLPPVTFGSDPRSWPSQRFPWLAPAWPGAMLLRSSELQIRLIRASELNTHLREMNLAAAGLAHETRNPLNIIRGLAQMISKQPAVPSEMQHKSREIIGEAVVPWSYPKFP